MTDEDRADATFGPGGYLPERAAARARKIILRSPLGLHWIWASLAAGLVVLVAGLLFLTRSQVPGPPFVEVGARADFGATAVEVDGVLLLTATGVVKAFDAPPGTVYCEATSQLEAPDGRVWSLVGRGQGTPSLIGYPVLVVNGIVYLDPTSPQEGPRPTADAGNGPAGCA